MEFLGPGGTERPSNTLLNSETPNLPVAKATHAPLPTPNFSTCLPLCDTLTATFRFPVNALSICKRERFMIYMLIYNCHERTIGKHISTTLAAGVSERDWELSFADADALSPSSRWSCWSWRIDWLGKIVQDIRNKRPKRAAVAIKLYRICAIRRQAICLTL